MLVLFWVTIGYLDMIDLRYGILGVFSILTCIFKTIFGNVLDFLLVDLLILRATADHR